MEYSGDTALWKIFHGRIISESMQQSPDIILCISHCFFCHACDNILAPLDSFQTRFFMRSLHFICGRAVLFQSIASAVQTRHGHAGSYAQMRVEEGS